jgi:hypothetical protein
MEMKQTKIGCNRNKPRVWIEGQVLIDAGFTRGKFFTATITPKRMTLVVHAEGNRTVSGKGEKPVVDIATADLLQLGPIGTRLNIVTTHKLIQLTPAAQLELGRSK